MKEILEKILEETKYQSKLLEDLFHQRDESRANSQEMKKRVKGQMDVLFEQMKNMPGMQDNPQAMDMLTKIMGGIVK